MVEDKQLSQHLGENGWWIALNSVERNELLTKPDRFVEKGVPMTYDACNEVMVVYDERGWPWIKRLSSHVLVGEGVIWDLFQQLTVMPYDLKRGAYVPHAKDGGAYVRRILPRPELCRYRGR